MLFFRSLFCLLFSLFLVSCGFQPLHQAHMGPSDICYPIKIATIKNREGQVLRNYLVDIITPQGTPQKPEYLLEVDLTTQIENVGINKDETTSRKKATLTANFRLKDMKTNTVVYSHSTSVTNSYNVLALNYYADLVASEYAKEEASRILAEKIFLLLNTHFDLKV